MVLCAIDDLMFCSKVRGAANQAGVPLSFVRSPEALLTLAREAAPSLVIIDLNADRLRPLEMLAGLRDDSTLATIRTVAFVSHVHAERIEAARAVGAEHILARSAFVAQLADLMRSAS